MPDISVPHHSLFIFLLYLKFVFNSVAKHGEVCGKLVEELVHNLAGQLVHVDLLEAASTSSTTLLDSPVLPGQLQRCPLVFADSQTGKRVGMREGVIQSKWNSQDHFTC